MIAFLLQWLLEFQHYLIGATTNGFVENGQCVCVSSGLRKAVLVATR